MTVLDRLLGTCPRAAKALGLACLFAACTGNIASDPAGSPMGAAPGGGVSPGDPAPTPPRGGSSPMQPSTPGVVLPPGGAAPPPADPVNPAPVNPTNPTNPTNPPPGGSTPPAVAYQCKAPTSVGYRTLRLLTREQYQNTVKDLLAIDFDVTKQLPPDGASGSFLNNNDLSVLEASYVSYVQVGEKIAAWSAQRNFSPALACGTVDQACAQKLVDELGLRLFRRPLTADEKQMYLGIARGSATAGDVKKGIEVALAAMLSAPPFIYRHELGEPNPALGADVYELTPYELASFLSYTFTASTPDRELLDAARNGALATPEQIEKQATRLINGSRATALFKDLVHRWLGTANLEIYTKDPKQYPTFTQVVPHMKAELSAMFTHVMLQSGETYRSLYDPGYTFANAPLAQHYGLSGVGGDQVQKVTATNRGGLLLSGAFLSKWAHPDEANPMTRAVHVRRDFLCQDVPDPPADVNISRTGKAGQLESFLAAPTTTNRMAFQRLTEDPACQVCHSQVINPLGFGLEDYDAVGKVRTTDRKGNAIDATGALWSPLPHLQLQHDPGSADARIEFKGGKGLARLLAEDPRVSAMAKSCLAKQVMSFATGVDARSIGETERKSVVVLGGGEKDAYNCDVARMVDVLSTGSPRKMLEKLATLSSIRYRKAWTR